ncbi:MAG TPA: hypothetical protein VE085_03675 [Burkholderiales bacterium]|nr:hypothetical protein [Burkholderiales bacterium]
MKLLALLLALTLASGSAMAQRNADREPRGAGGKNQGMSKDQRERMRQDMRNVYQDKGGQARPQQRQMSPQEREKLRRDIQDANRELRR